MMTLAVAGQSPTLCAAALWIAAHEQANLATAEARNDRGPGTADAAAAVENRTALNPRRITVGRVGKPGISLEAEPELLPPHGAWAFHFSLPPPVL